MSTGDWTHVRSASELHPNKTYFAILSDASMSVPGDQRSIDAPGHGYPASTERYVDVRVTEDEGEWRAEAARLKSRAFGPGFRAVAITVAELVTDVRVEVRWNRPKD